MMLQLLTIKAGVANPETQKLCFFYPWILDPDPGSRMEKNQNPGWKKNRIRDGKKSGSEMEKNQDPS